jgi:hypothetical protein
MKKFGLFFFTLALMVHLPIAFGKSIPGNIIFPVTSETPTTVSDNTAAKKQDSVTTVIGSMYDHLKLSSMGLSRQVFDYAYQGFTYLKEIGKISNDHILSIIDFSKSSAKKRLFIIDLTKMKVLFNTYVAHGQNSGQEYAEHFSNSEESLESSLGFYTTEDTYIGKHGYSLHLQGLEKGFNDKAYDREIVMHGADYVNEQLIRARGYIGRSWGCPAIAPRLVKPIISKVKNGTCLFIYSPDQNYVSNSQILKQGYAPLLAYNNK